MEYKGLYEHEGLEIDEIKRNETSILETILSMIEDDFYKEIVSEMMKDHGHSFVECVGSASKHHNYIGGLVDHTLEVVKIARAMGECFPGKVNMDLITTGAFLHDFGKIVSYESSPNLKSGKRPKKAFQRSAEDKVMGHFGEGIRMIYELDDYLASYDLDKIRPLIHIIASHHGEARLNWGSMTDPVTNEAHIVALADLLSSRIK